MRGRDEVMALRVARFQIEDSLLLWALVLAMALGATIGFFACCLAGDRKRRRAELEEQSSSTLSMRGLTPGAQRLYRRARREAQEELKTGEYRLHRHSLTYINIPATVIVVILNEVYITYKAALPVREKPYAVGQWMPVVTIALAFAAAAINDSYRDEWEKLQKIYEADRAVEEERRRPCIAQYRGR